jgi:tetratricopeptide (TPR) repeat protein
VRVESRLGTILERDEKPGRSDHDLLLLAEIDPTRARTAAAEAVEHAVTDRDRVREAHARRALGVALRILGRPHDGLEELDLALQLLDGDRRLTGLVLASRSACHMAVGDVPTALADLDRAVDMLDGVDLAFAQYQRSSIVVRLTDDPLAERELDLAIIELTRGRSRMYEAHARNNRGLLRTYGGEFGAARSDLERARRLYLDLGIVTTAAVVLHNLAFLDTRCGDIISALEQFSQARQEFDRVGLDPGVLDLDCCDALLAAGLGREALQRAKDASVALRSGGNLFELPEAQLVAAVASQRCGDLDGASRWASEAVVQFSELGRTSWAHLAELVRLSCAELGPSTTSAALDLADRLDDDGMVLGAMQARLLASQMLLQRGLLDESHSNLGRLRSRRLPPDLRLGVCELEARIADSAGLDRACQRWIGRGVQVLDRFQRSFASAEIRWSVTTHAKGILELSRDRAFRSGGAARLFRNIEIARANALRRAPLERPDDPDLARLLGELRIIANSLREPLDHSTARNMVARQWDVQRSIADRERSLRATAVAEEEAGIVTIGQLRGELDDCRVVLLDVIRGTMIAVCIDRRHATVQDLGPISTIAALFGAAGLALSRLARGDTGERSVRGAVERLGAIGRELDEVFAVCWPGDASVVVVPPADLHAAAWAVLPSLSQLRFTVAASATIWSRASRRNASDRSGVVLVGGSSLAHAAAEVRSIAKVYTSATSLTRARATASRVTQAIDGVWLAHFATHHHYQRENPLFGSMDLADGPLFLHDLLRVRALPTVVVLSACEAAQGSAAATGDVLGASTVLMERGTSTVIANAGLVSDSQRGGASMLQLHRHLALGDGPAAALLAVRCDAAGISPREGALVAGFTCFGAGW